MFSHFKCVMMMMNCFYGMVDWRKVFSLISSWGPLPEILTIANLWHAVSRIWTCAEPDFRRSWLKLCNSDNHYMTVPQNATKCAQNDSKQQVRMNLGMKLIKINLWGMKLFFCMWLGTHKYIYLIQSIHMGVVRHTMVFQK